MAIGRCRLLLLCSAGGAVEKKGIVLEEEGMSWLGEKRQGICVLRARRVIFSAGVERSSEGSLVEFGGSRVALQCSCVCSACPALTISNSNARNFRGPYV
jgi:hypothetical protein